MKNSYIVLIIMALSAVLIMNPTNLFKAEFTGGGFDVTSISQTKIISNDADLSTANFIIETVTNGGGQYLVGTTEFEQELSKTTPLTVDIKYPLEIRMSPITETLQYNILNGGSLDKFAYSYTNELEQKPFESLTDFFNRVRAECGAVTWCIPSQTQKEGWGFPQYNYNKFRGLKINTQVVGSIGDLQLSKVGWSGTASITINGVTYSKEMGDGTVAVDFIDNSGRWIGQASWVGSLVTGDVTPRQDLFKATYLQSSNIWKISPLNPYYYNYDASFKDAKTKLDTWIATPTVGCDAYPCGTVESILNTHNNNGNTFSSQNVPVSYVSSTSTNTLSSSRTTGTSTNGALTETIDRKITRPVIVWKIKASSIAVVIAVGKPQILSIDSKPFASGDGDGQALVTIKNIGTGTGRFAATFTESSNTFKPSTTSQSSQVTLNTGDTGVITLYISHGTTASDIKKTGTVRVYDVNKPSNEATMNFEITMTSPKACTAGTYKTEGNSVYKCRSDGSGYDLVFNCDTGTIKWVNGIPSCDTSGGGGGGGGGGGNGGTFEIILKDWLASPLLIPLIVLVILIVVSIKRKKT